MRQTAPSPARLAVRSQTTFIALVTLALLTASYAVVRYGGLWGEIDTRNAAIFIREMYDSGRLVPARGAYPNGYAFQTLAVFLMNASGLSLPALQTIAASVLAVWLVWPAWLVYREFTETARGAALATVILLTQPEFLFVVMRGTHEKFTRGLMLLCLYLLLRSLRDRNRLHRFAAFVLAFYLCVYGVISFNNLIATSFTVSLVLALLLIGPFSLVKRLGLGLTQPPISRLLVILATALVLAFLFTFFLYRPALHDLTVMETMFDRLVALFLDVETASTNPYSQWVAPAWINLPAYFTLTLANWLLLIVSALLWLRQSVTWLFRRRQPANEQDVFLWAFYGAFAFMGAVSILIDVTGVLSANLQHRAFSSFAMLAAPLAAKWLVNAIDSSPLHSRRSYAVLGTLFTLLAALSILKATNEPLFSNKWLFHNLGEVTAVDWAEDALQGRVLWSGYDERLVMNVQIRSGGRFANLGFDAAEVERGTRDFLLSRIIKGRQLRLQLLLPVRGDDLQTYDNGEARVFHRRPVTPYQR